MMVIFTKHKIFFALLLIFSLALFGQGIKYSDSVHDKESTEVLVFVNRISSNGQYEIGTAIDVEPKNSEAVSTGKIRWGYLDLLLNRFVGFNSFEGFWFGMGAQSNKYFSKKLTFGGYYAYSLKDRQSKFGAKVSVLISKSNEIKAHLGFLSDNVESGNVDFLNDENSLYDPLALQRYFINRMNYTLREGFGLSARLFKPLLVYGGINHETIEHVGDYLFSQPETNKVYRAFNSTEVQFKLRFAFKVEKYDNEQVMHSRGNLYPIFWFNYTQGISELLGGDFDYKKLDFHLQKTFYMKSLGKTSINLKAGLVIGDVPYAKLYSGGGTYRPFVICAPASFGTMRSNEFLSDSYIFLFIAHNFGSLIFKGEKFKPEFELMTNIGFGWLEHPDYHKNIIINTMELGYYESGLMINNLLPLPLLSFGLGAIYRYGPYGFSNFKDNMAYKFTITLPIEPQY